MHATGLGEDVPIRAAMLSYIAPDNNATALRQAGPTIKEQDCVLVDIQVLLSEGSSISKHDLSTGIEMVLANLLDPWLTADATVNVLGWIEDTQDGGHRGNLSMQETKGELSTADEVGSGSSKHTTSGDIERIHEPRRGHASTRKFDDKTLAQAERERPSPSGSDVDGKSPVGVHLSSRGAGDPGKAGAAQPLPEAYQANKIKIGDSERSSVAEKLSYKLVPNGQEAPTQKLQAAEAQSQAVDSDVKSSVLESRGASAQETLLHGQITGFGWKLTGGHGGGSTLTATVLLAGMEVQDVADVVAKLESYQLMQSLKAHLNQRFRADGKPIQWMRVVAAMRSTLLSVPQSTVVQLPSMGGPSRNWKDMVKQAADAAKIQVPENVWVLSMSSDGDLTAASKDLPEIEAPAAAGFSARQVIVLVLALGSITLCFALLCICTNFRQRRPKWSSQVGRYQRGGLGQALGESALSVLPSLQLFSSSALRVSSESWKQSGESTPSAVQADGCWLQAPQRGFERVSVLQPGVSLSDLADPRRSTVDEAYLAVQRMRSVTMETAVSAVGDGAEAGDPFQDQPRDTHPGCSFLIYSLLLL
jgi:hypothetical protein